MSADKQAPPAPDETTEARNRLPYADPAEIVRPAHPEPNHLAIVITCLAVMLAVAVITLVVTFTGRTMTGTGVRVIASVTIAGILIMFVTDRWYRWRRNR